MPKYKPAFLRDYDFYLKNSNQFNYPYDNIPDIRYNPDGLDAKACFWFLDSQGVLKDCKEPDVLKMILICKKSVFFHIKLWSHGFDDIMESVDYYLKTFHEPPDWIKKSLENQLKK